MQPAGCYLSTEAGIIQGFADALICQLEGVCRVCVYSCRCKVVSDALRVRGRAQFDELQAAGPAAVLLQPDQRLLFAYRRPLPSSSSRQGEITSARTYARPHTRPACLERAHTQPMRRLLAREPVLTAAVECVRVAAPRQCRAADGRATPWRAWHVRVLVYVYVSAVPVETSSRMSCRRRKPRSFSLKIA